MSSGEYYFNRLSEKERKAAVQGFYDYVTRAERSQVITHERLRCLFKQYCLEVLDRRPGVTFMRYKDYTFLLVRKLRVLKMTTSRGEKTYTVQPWPPELSPDEQKKAYLTSLKQLLTTEPLSSNHNKKEVMTEVVGSLVCTPQLREVLMQNKFDVTVTTTHGLADDAKLTFPPVVLETVILAGTQTPLKRNILPVEIENTSTCHIKTLSCVGFLDGSSDFFLEDEHRISSRHESALEIPPQSGYTITVVFAPKTVSLYKDTLIFEFLDGGSGEKFHIIRFVKGRAETRSMEMLRPTAPYQRSKMRPRSRLPVVDGVKPPRPEHRTRMDRKPAFYDIPVSIFQQMTIGEPQGALKELLLRNDEETHRERFDALLWIEEKQMHRDIRKYDRKKDMKAIPGGYLKLEVPGLAENRPSLLKGDQIYARWPGATSKYRGYVHKVELETVLLKFNRTFHDIFVPGMQYDIEFTFNRYPQRHQHRALELAQGLPKGVLFPRSGLQKSHHVATDKPLILYDPDVARNPEQEQAVKAIVSGQSSPAPYIIYGPPGTGKTKTSVEAIKQVLKVIPGSRVLACAPSNSAADLLCQGIVKHWPKREVLRLNAYSRARTRDIPDSVLEVSWQYDQETKSFEMPLRNKLDGYRVIVSTLTTAGRLVSIPIPAGHFTHVFVDEAGHAVEPECLIPVAGLLHPDKCNLVMAGDPKQLGPILRSKAAIDHRLKVSFLERLMTEFDIYKRQALSELHNSHYNSKAVTKLIENYRSHPAILKLPNEEFYDGELQERADKIVTRSLCEWEHLPKKGFPVIFHGVEGKDEREADSPSFFNIQEVATCCGYVKQILEARDIKVTVTPKEIGVISPYRKQVEKIRIYLRKNLPSCGELKVGSVEEFQGQERKVIIVSTVRSSATYLAMDRDYNLGFLDNPKRFNVAITRAKALLVVVGNPKLLSRDKYWKKLIMYVKSNGGYTGIEFGDPAPTDDSLSYPGDEGSDGSDNSGDDEPPESQITGQEDPEWRNDD